MLLLTLVAEGIAGSSWSFEGLPSPSTERVVDLATRGDDVAALTSDGAVYRWTGSTWVSVVPGGGLASDLPRGLEIDLGGEIWGRTSGPPRLRRGSPEGWAPAEGSSFAAWYFPIRDGEVLAVLSYEGILARRSGDGTWPQLDLRLGNFRGADVDETGSVHVVTDGGAWRVGPDDVVERALAPDGANGVWAGPGGVWWSTPTSYTWARPGQPLVFELPTADLRPYRDGAWVRRGDPPALVHLAADGTTEDLAPPARIADFEVTDDGTLWLVTEPGLVLRSVPAGLPTVRDVTSEWTVPSAQVQWARAADLDRDGLEDVLAVVGSPSRLAAWVQTAHGLVDQSAALGLAREGVSRAWPCALSEAAPPWIVAQPADPAAPMTLARPVRGTYVDAGAEAGFDRGAWGKTRPQPAVRCEDLDGDGDRDLVVTHGEHRQATTAALRIWENVLQGRLREVALPARGLRRRGFQWDAHLRDLDRDKRLDGVLINAWGDGHEVLQGTPDGWRTRPDRGLRGAYPEVPDLSWLEDLDGDTRPDLLVLERGLGPRVWRGREDLRFEEATEAMGLGGLDRAPLRAADLVDLTGDGALDLVYCGDPCGVWVNTSGRLVRVPWVGAPEKVDAVAALRTARGHALVAFHAARASVFVLDHAPAPLRPGDRWAEAWRREAAWFPWPLALALLARGVAEAVWVGRRWGVALAAAWAVSSTIAVGVAIAVSPLVTALVGAGSAGCAAVAGAWPRATPKAGTAPGERVGSTDLVFRRPVGRGGAAVVHEVWDPHLRASRALKLLHTPDGDPGVVARLEAEAQLLANLRHDHLVRVFALVDHHGQPGILMELLSGGSLEDDVAARGPWPADRVVRVGADLAEALAYVHERGVLHRDVKPANVLFDDAGRPALADFGVALRPEQQLTTTIAVMGTWAYMPPEVRDFGAPPSPSADVFSLAATLFFAATGEGPAALAYDDRRRAALGRLPERLREVLDAATRVDPTTRTATATAFVAALRAVSP